MQLGSIIRPYTPSRREVHLVNSLVTNLTNVFSYYRQFRAGLVFSLSYLHLIHNRFYMWHYVLLCPIYIKLLSLSVLKSTTLKIEELRPFVFWLSSCCFFKTLLASSIIDLISKSKVRHSSLDYLTLDW